MRNLIAILCGLMIVAVAFASFPTADRAPNIGPVAKEGFVDAQWDVLWAYNAQTICQDNQLLGIEFANNMWWVTGGNNGLDPNQMYRLTPTGAIVDSANQPAAATGWGIRDLAYDGSYVYGGCEPATIFAFDPVTGANVPSMNIPRPAGNTCVRALAYDPATDHFWTGNFGANIIEFDRSGAIIWQGAPPAGCVAIYGMAWDNSNPATPWLWLHNQSPDGTGVGLGCTFFKYNPTTHVLVGAGYTVPLQGGNTGSLAGGACFTGAYNPSFKVMAGVSQGTPLDNIFVLEMYPQGGGQTLDINTSAVRPPVIIPANGGTFQYNISVHVLATSPQTFQIWNKVRSGTTYFQVFGPISRTLPGGANPARVLNQTISGSIPSGTLSFISYIGTYPSTIVDTSFFTITKSAVADGNPWIAESNGSGDFLDEYAVSTAAPAEFALVSNFPNPFNPTTNISYTLPNAGNVKLSVFDATGREVATLVNGYRDAGSHSVTFDGSNLASGIYMYRLTSGGQVASGKMVMMK
ncbi:MAG: T9SS type A sorting domain-containing protein [bacterium]|nr:T9SS type A sorting domain-containing protein [bacterium]